MTLFRFPLNKQNRKKNEILYQFTLTQKRRTPLFPLSYYNVSFCHILVRTYDGMYVRGPVFHCSSQFSGKWYKASDRQTDPPTKDLINFFIWPVIGFNLLLLPKQAVFKYLFSPTHKQTHTHIRTHCLTKWHMCVCVCRCECLGSWGRNLQVVK